MIQRRNRIRNRGFTIIELMLAMAFVSLLLLSIAITVMQVGAIYNKGVTLKSVNQAGRIIVTDMKRTIGDSQVFDVRRATTYNSRDRGGRLCTGTYSYIWNIGRYEDLYTYSGSSNPGKSIRLLKIKDNGGRFCVSTSNNINFDSTKMTELLSVGDLAVQDFRITGLTNNAATGSALYNIEITISNAETAAIIETVSPQCKPPSQDATYQNYCAVNKFVFTAQADDKGGQ